MSNVFKKFYIDLHSADAKQRIIQGLKTNGLVTFSNITKCSELIDLANSLGSIFVQDDTDARGIKTIDDKAAMQGSGYHTDRASMDPPPSLILLWCKEQANQGGESIFSDAEQIYRMLKIDYPDVLEAFLTPASACFGMGPYLSRGAVFNVAANGNIYIKWRSDNHMYLSTNLYKYFPILAELIEKCSISFRLNKDDGYIVQNGRWLHGGKPSIGGKRILYRVLINGLLDSDEEQSEEFGFMP